MMGCPRHPRDANPGSSELPFREWIGEVILNTDCEPLAYGQGPRAFTKNFSSSTRGPEVEPAGGGFCGCVGFLLRTACVSSVPTESSHTARAAMLGQFRLGLRGLRR